MTRLVSTLTGVTLALALFYATDVISKGPEGQAGAIPRFEQVAPAFTGEGSQRRRDLSS